MGNAKKTVINIPKLSVGQYLLIFDICYYLKTSLIYSRFFIYIKNLFWQKRHEMLKL